MRNVVFDFEYLLISYILLMKLPVLVPNAAVAAAAARHPRAAAAATAALGSNIGNFIRRI